MTDSWIDRLSRGDRRAHVITIAAMLAIGIVGGLALAWVGTP